MRLEQARVLLEQLHFTHSILSGVSLTYNLSMKKKMKLKKSRCYRELFELADQLQKQQKTVWFLPYREDGSSEVGFVAHAFGTTDFAAFLWSDFPSKHSLLLNKKKAII